MKRFFKQFLSYLSGILIFIGLIVISIVLLNAFFYFDPLNRCFIVLDENVTRGNKKTVREALGHIKQTDDKSYQRVCKYVETISEDYCTISHMSPSDSEQAPGRGCYIKGSKTIYLIPTTSDSEIVVKQRAEDILKFSRLSENFWSTY